MGGRGGGGDGIGRGASVCGGAWVASGGLVGAGTGGWGGRPGISEGAAGKQED